MKTKLVGLPWLIPSLIFALATPLTAQVVRMGGGLRSGFARPPLYLNLNPLDATSNYGPYSPAQIRKAYGVDQLSPTGAGQKIGIVDAYGDPSIQTDLNNFCNYYGIASTTVQILYPQGQPSTGNSGWALETALDVEWAHAIAPNATIILSVAKSASFSDLLGAVTAAVNAGANVISMSWGGPEFSGANSYDSYFQAPGVTYVASSGDSGELAAPFEVDWPASSPYVVSVGGTTLYLDATGNRIQPSGVGSSETAWSGSGGGLSAVYSQPAFQVGWQNFGIRCVPDVSYVADPNTGVGVAYGPYLYEVGGTSAGAPQWAALIALANQSRSTGVGGNTDIYKVAGTAPSINPLNFLDITSGANGTDPDDFSVIGYDLVTGLGSPAAAGLVPALAALAPTAPDFSLTLTPASQAVTPGASVSYTVTVTSLGGFNGSVSLTVTLPSGASGGSFTVNPVTGGAGTSVLTFTAPAGTGNYALSVTGASGSLSHMANAALVVGNPDFSLTASPASQSVRRGNSTSFTVNVTSSGGFTGVVGFSVSGLPSNTRASFTPTSVTGSGSTRLTIRTGSRTPRGTYRLTITGASGSLAHSTSVSLTVN